MSSTEKTESTKSTFFILISTEDKISKKYKARRLIEIQITRIEMSFTWNFLPRKIEKQRSNVVAFSKICPRIVSDAAHISWPLVRISDIKFTQRVIFCNVQFLKLILINDRWDRLV